MIGARLRCTKRGNYIACGLIRSVSTLSNAELIGMLDAGGITSTSAMLNANLNRPIIIDYTSFEGGSSQGWSGGYSGYGASMADNYAGRQLDGSYGWTLSAGQSGVQSGTAWLTKTYTNYTGGDISFYWSTPSYSYTACTFSIDGVVKSTSVKDTIWRGQSIVGDGIPRTVVLRFELSGTYCVSFIDAISVPVYG